MIRAAHSIAVLLLFSVSTAHAANITVHFEGTVKSVVDASTAELPSIDFTPAPVGSAFSGTFAYDDESPLTYGGTGFSQFIDIPSSTASLSLNGQSFGSEGTLSALPVSAESGFGFSGISFVNQPLTLPEGWSVSASHLPYFTVQLRDESPQTRSLALPSLQEEFPTDTMTLVLDFQHPVTVAGQAYGGRVYLTGEITTLTVVGPPPPPQEVAVDVVPSSSDNTINLSTKKPKPLDVAVFGSPAFEVLSVIPETIGVGDPILTHPETGSGQKVAPGEIRYVDINSDGELDLLLRFHLLDLKDAGAIDSFSTSLEFEGILENGGVAFGSDAVSISGGKGKGRK